jgi:hypothetical protein
MGRGRAPLMQVAQPMVAAGVERRSRKALGQPELPITRGGDGPRDGPGHIRSCLARVPGDDHGPLPGRKTPHSGFHVFSRVLSERHVDEITFQVRFFYTPSFLIECGRDDVAYIIGAELRDVDDLHLRLAAPTPIPRLQLGSRESNKGADSAGKLGNQRRCRRRVGGHAVPVSGIFAWFAKGRRFGDHGDELSERLGER